VLCFAGHARLVTQPLLPSGPSLGTLLSFHRLRSKLALPGACHACIIPSMPTAASGLAGLIARSLVHLVAGRRGLELDDTEAPYIGRPWSSRTCASSYARFDRPMGHSGCSRWEAGRLGDWAV